MAVLWATDKVNEMMERLKLKRNQNLSLVYSCG